MKALDRGLLLDRMPTTARRNRPRAWPWIVCLALIGGGIDLSAEDAFDRGVISTWHGTQSSRSDLGKRRRRNRRSRATADVAPQAPSLSAIRADLHDGPAQYLAFALMYLDELAPSGPLEKDPKHEAYQRIRAALVAALDETRAIAAGTSLEALRPLDPARVIAHAIGNHEAQTRTTVAQNIGRLPTKLAQATKICLYRFTQEGLNNAYRHARGQGQRLTVEMTGSDILAEVADDGPGVDSTRAWSTGLGLVSLRQRAEAVGGRLELVHEPGKGVRLRLRLPTATSQDRQGVGDV